MSDWKLVHVDEGKNGTSKIYQDSKGNVKIDSFFGNVKDPDNHDRLTINTKDNSVSGHGFNHDNPFDTRNDNKDKKR